jgi:hypothetical protein
MVKIHFIPKVVEARPKSAMHRFSIRASFSIASHAGRTVVARVDVHALSLMNVHGVLGPFFIVFLLSFQTGCHHPLIIGSMLYLCYLFFHPLSVFV